MPLILILGAGHIYVPKVKKCLEVPSYDPGSTYKLLLKDCYYSDDSGQFAQSFLQKGSKYYWVRYIRVYRHRFYLLLFSLAQPLVTARSSKTMTRAARLAYTVMKAPRVTLPLPQVTPLLLVPLVPTSAPSPSSNSSRPTNDWSLNECDKRPLRSRFSRILTDMAWIFANKTVF